VQSGANPVITNKLNDMGLTWDVITNNEIVSTDFDNYDLIVIGESVGDREYIPYNEVSSIFFDRQIAQEAWNIVNSGKRSEQDIRVTNLQSFIYEDVNINLATNEVRVYAPLAKEFHYIIGGSTTVVGLTT